MSSIVDGSYLTLPDRIGLLVWPAFWYNGRSGREEERLYRAQGKRIHANRAFGRNRHHCAVNGRVNAGPAAGQRTGEGGSLSIKSETMGPLLLAVHG